MESALAAGAVIEQRPFFRFDTPDIAEAGPCPESPLADDSGTASRQRGTGSRTAETIHDSRRPCGSVARAFSFGTN
jgi:hypothetical protein